MGFGLDELSSDIITGPIGVVIGNPIWTALIITSIILIIIYLVFAGPYNEMLEETDGETSFIRLIFRAGIYIVLSTLGVVLIHYQSLAHDLDNRTENKLLRETVNETTGVNIAPLMPPPKVGNDEQPIKLEISTRPMIRVVEAAATTTPVVKPSS